MGADPRGARGGDAGTDAAAAAEAAEGDALEQRLPAAETDEPADPLAEFAARGVPLEAPEADAWEQAEEVPDILDEPEPGTGAGAEPGAEVEVEPPADS
jgi:hypothetical protein